MYSGLIGAYSALGSRVLYVYREQKSISGVKERK